MITIVSGFQRCGTSLVLQMLAAGGMKVFHSPEMGYPAFENHQQQVSRSFDWMDQLDGFALKWLEPLAFTPPYRCAHPMRIIWCTRDPDEQGKSAVKFLAAVTGVKARAVDFSESFRLDEPSALELWRFRGLVHVQHFEELIGAKTVAAKNIRSFLDREDLDLDAMTAQVRERPPHACPIYSKRRLMQDPRAMEGAA